MKNVTLLVGLCLTTAAVFADSLVLAPGYGVTTNVAERIVGTFDRVEINVGSAGGGIVDFSSSWSLYSGAAVVNCGTLLLSGDLRPMGQPSVLGRGCTDEAITVKDGTFRYAGAPAETDRGLVFAPSGADKAAVVSVAAGTSLKMTGPVSSENGVFVKRGEGALVLAPASSAATNVFCHASLAGAGALSFPANGDAPTAGYGEFTVQEGRLALDFPPDSVNILHGGAVTGGKAATIIGCTPANETAAHEAHLEIRSGKFHAGRYVYVGNCAGTVLTTEEPLHHSLDVYGGLFDNNHGEGCAIYVGHSAGSANRSVGELNVYGGKVSTFYFRPGCSPASVARVFVSGGTLDCYGVYAGQYAVGDNSHNIVSWDDPEAALISDLEIHVSTNGILNLRGGPYYMSRDSLVRHTLKVTDGGRMNFRGFEPAVDSQELKQNERMTVLLDDGTLDVSVQNRTDMCSRPGVTTQLGLRGGRLNSGFAAAVYTFWGPIVKAEGVARDGGLKLDGPATYRLFCENTFEGDVNLVGSGTLVLSNGLSRAGVNLGFAGVLAAATPVVSLPSLVCRDVTATLELSYANSTATRYDLGGFTPPQNILYLKLKGAFPAGEHEIMSYPAGTVFDVGQVLVEGGNFSGGNKYSFRTAAADGRVKLVMQVTPASTPAATAVSWGNGAGGDWNVAGNWSGAAPAAGQPAAVTFAAAPTADPATVTLDGEQQITKLSFPASPGYRIAGSGSIALDNGGQAVTISAAGGATNKVDVPVSANGKLTFDVPKRGHVEFASVSGSADIATTVDAAGYGGVVKIADAHELRGAISFQRGLLELGTMPAALTALEIGFGEFRYTGAEAKRLACPISFIGTQYSNSKVCVADPAGELHIDGTFTMPNGSFSKHGKGLLAFDGARDYSFALNASYYGLFDHTVQMTDMIADPKWGFMWESSGRDRSQPTTIAGGTMRWGVPGQRVTINRVGGSDAFVVGCVSTAEPGKEFDAYAEINGGETELLGILYTGHRHGHPDTAEHSVLTSRVTMTAGNLRGTQMWQLNDDKRVCASRSEWLQQGGTARFSSDINFGKVGSAACSAFTEVSGGELGCDGNAFMGNDGNNRASSVVRLVGGLLDCKGGFYMCYGTNRLEVLEGGTLRTQAINSYANQKNRVLFDGGVFKPYHPTGSGCGCNENVREFALGAKGMVVDLSDMPVNILTFQCALSVAEGVAQDGGVIVQGLNGHNPGVFAFATQQQTNFSGVVTVKAGGNVRVASNPCVTSNLTVTVKSGGAIGAQWTSHEGLYGCVKKLALGESAADTAIIQVHTGIPDYDGKYAGTMWATEELSVPGTVDVAFVSNFHEHFVLPSYEVMVLIAPKGSIDASKFRLSAKCSAATANFAVESFNADYDKLTVTLSAPTAAEHTWTALGGGDWSEPANWSAVPTDSTYDSILFPATFAGGTIALGGARTAMAVSSAGEGVVALTGGTLSLASAPAVSTVAGGELRLPALDAESEVAVNAAAPAGKVVFTESKGDTAISSKSGTVEGTPASFGTGDVKINNSTVSVTGEGMVSAKIAGTGGMNLRSEGEAYFMKDVSTTGPFMKTGPGTAYLCGSGTVTLGSVNRTTSSPSPTQYDNSTDSFTHVPSNGDMPTDSLGGAMTIAAGKLVLGVDGSQKVNVGARLDIGTSFYELDGEGNVVGSELEMLGGTLTGSSDLNIGRNPGRYAKEDPTLVGKRRDLAFTIRGGEASFGSFYMMHDNSGKFSGNAYLNVFGGHLMFKNTYLNLGYHYRAGSTNFVNVGGGLLEFAATKPNWANGILGGLVVVNLTGGEFKTVYPLSSQSTENNKYVVYNLAGGRLNVPCLRRVNAQGVENLVWDGGVYAPTSNNCSIACQKTWTKHECRQGGAKIDLSGVVPVNPGDPIAFSMNQTLAHAEELGAQEDGGIELLGGGTLTLDVANTMNGPVIASGGVVRPTVVGAVNGGVVVNGDGVFDVNGLAVAATYLKGAGGTVAGGTLTVLGEIAPATFVTVGSLACGPDAVLKCPLNEVEEGVYSTTLVKVASNGAVITDGKLVVDFCLDEDDVLPKDFSVKIAELGENATFPAQLGVVKTGREPKHYQLDANFRAGEGCTEVWATLRGPATVIYFR